MTADALARAAAMGFDDYDPGLVARSVNELLPLGKDGALDRIALHGDATGLFWVLRAAFEMPADPSFPPVRLGAPEPPSPPDPAALPRFPIVLALDLPLLAVSGYELGGLAETPADHIPHYRAHGTLRARPLAPSGDPAAVEQEFLRQWRAAYGPGAPDVSDRLRAQITRAIDAAAR